MVFRLSFHQKKDSARALLHGDSGVNVMLTPLSLALVLPYCFCFCLASCNFFLGYMRHKTQGRHTGHTNIRGCIPKWQGAGCWNTHEHPRTRMLLRHAGAPCTCTLKCCVLRAGMLVCLCCWVAPPHCSMPATRVLACWGACQQHTQAIQSLLLRWLAIECI